MGVKGLTSYVRMQFPSLFRATDLSVHPSVLVVDYSALVHHIHNLIEAAGFCDGTPTAAFSFAREYLLTLEKAGVQHVCYVYDGLQASDSMKTDERNQRAAQRVIKRADFVQDPTNLGVPLISIESSYSSARSAISAAIFWVHRISPKMKASGFRWDGEADHLVASKAAEMAAEFPKAKVYALTNDSDMLFMLPTPNVILLDDFSVDVKKGTVKMKFLPAGSLCTNGFKLSDPKFMPLLATLLANDYIPSDVLLPFHDKIIREAVVGKEVICMPVNVAGAGENVGCDAGLTTFDKRHPDRIYGEYCINPTCNKKHATKRKTNFSQRPFFLKLVSKKQIENFGEAAPKVKDFFEEELRRRCENSEGEDDARGVVITPLLTSNSPTPKGCFEVVQLATRTWPTVGKPTIVLLFEHLYQLNAAREAMDDDETPKPSVLRSCEQIFRPRDIMALTISCLSNMFNRDAALFKRDNKSELDATRLATKYFGSASSAPMFARVYQQYCSNGAPTPCSCTYVESKRTAQLLQSKQDYLEDGTEEGANNPHALSSRDLVSPLEQLLYGITLGLQSTVSVTGTGMSRNAKTGQAMHTISEHQVQGALLPTDMTGPATAAATKALSALVRGDSDSNLLSNWGLMPPQGKGGGGSWNELDFDGKVALLQSTSAPLRFSLLTHMLGVVDEGEEADALRVRVEDGKDDASLSESVSMPLSLVLPTAALRFWIMETHKNGDAISDAEVQAALSGIVCAFEPTLAGNQIQSDPMSRLARKQQFALWQKAQEQDGLSLEGKTIEDFTSASTKPPSVVRVTGGLRYGLIGTLSGNVKEIDPDPDAEYSVTPLPLPSLASQEGWMAPEPIKCIHLQLTVLKPEWVTPMGLRRLAQWTETLSLVTALSRAMQLPLPSTEMYIDAADFLFAHWTAMQGAGQGWHGGQYLPSANPRVPTKEYSVTPHTKSAMEQLVQSWRDNGRKDPVRAQITTRCGGVKAEKKAKTPEERKAAGETRKAMVDRLLGLFDALLKAAVHSTAKVADLVNVAVCKCEAQQELTLLAQDEDEDTDDDWDASSDDEADAAGAGAGAGGVGAAYAACLKAAGEATGSSLDNVAWASVRLMTLLPRSELVQVIGGEDSAVTSAQCPGAKEIDAALAEITERLRAADGNQDETVFYAL